MITSYIYTSEGEIYGLYKVDIESCHDALMGQTANHYAGNATARAGFNYTDQGGSEWRKH